MPVFNVIRNIYEEQLKYFLQAWSVFFLNIVIHWYHYFTNLSKIASYNSTTVQAVCNTLI